MVKNFYIFRHGQSSYNLEGRIQGHTNNSVLTNQGIDEAHNAASLLQDKKIEIVVSSPLRRAKQTGSIVSKMIKVPLQYDDRFTEVNVGIAEGLHYTKAQQKFGDLYRLSSPYESRVASLMYVRKDRAVVFAWLMDKWLADAPPPLRLKGLKPKGTEYG